MKQENEVGRPACGGRRKEKTETGFLSEELHRAFVAGESGRVYDGKPTKKFDKVQPKKWA